MTERICATTGCWTYTRGDAKYCLACQLDNKIPQPPLNRMGQPSAIVEHIAHCELALEECERCERALMMVSNEEAHARLDQVWALLEKKRERRPR